MDHHFFIYWLINCTFEQALAIAHFGWPKPDPKSLFSSEFPIMMSLHFLVGSLWDFIRLILDLSMKVLSPSGKYFTQV